jgi:hypothetical protein
MTDAAPPPPAPRGWHVPPALLAGFTDDPGAVDDIAAASIDAHLLACGDCRQGLTAAAAPALAEASWAAVADRIDRPRPTVLEGLLRRLGIGTGTGRLLAATPALQLAGVAAVAVVAVAAGMLSRTAGANSVFLVLAPLVPLAAVAASFASAADPAGEAGVGTPLHGAGLVLRRAGAILTVNFGLLGAAALALPDLGPEAATWILPALALTLGSLALGTWLRAEVAVAVLGSGWLLTVSALWWFAGHDLAVADSAPFAATGQLAALAVSAAALTVLVARRDRFATLEVAR